MRWRAACPKDALLPLSLEGAKDCLARGIGATRDVTRGTTALVSHASRRKERRTIVRPGEARLTSARCPDRRVPARAARRAGQHKADPNPRPAVARAVRVRGVRPRHKRREGSLRAVLAAPRFHHGHPRATATLGKTRAAPVVPMAVCGQWSQPPALRRGRRIRGPQAERVAARMLRARHRHQPGVWHRRGRRARPRVPRAPTRLTPPGQAKAKPATTKGGPPKGSREPARVAHPQDRLPHQPGARNGPPRGARLSQVRPHAGPRPDLRPAPHRRGLSVRPIGQLPGRPVRERPSPNAGVPGERAAPRQP